MRPLELSLSFVLCAGCSKGLVGPSGAGDPAGGDSSATGDTTGGDASGDATAGDPGSSGDPNGAGDPGPITECNDGIDNDGDGWIDWQYDLGCHGERDNDEVAQPRAQEDGWTTFDKSPGSRVVYVKNGGNDALDGSSPDMAVETLARGVELVRDGEHDFLLLRRGDTWRGDGFGRFKSGQDGDHSLVVASYGDSTVRPRIELSDVLVNHDGHPRSHTAYVGLHLIAYTMVPGSADFTGTDHTGFRFVGSGDNLLVEDLHIEYGEIVLQSFGGSVYNHAEIRRNVVEKSFHTDTCGQNSTYRPSGMYASHAHDVLIEENLWDHNGWNSDEVASACATMYNHNLYLNSDDLTIRGNLILRASSMGIKMRSDATGDNDGLLIENNLFVSGDIGAGIGGNTSEPYRFSNTVIRNNVFAQVGLGLADRAEGRLFAWLLGLADHDVLTVEGNLFTTQPWYDNTYAIHVNGGTHRQTVIQNNTFYRIRRRSLRVEAAAGWDSVLVTNNVFVDPDQGACLVDHSGGHSAVTYAGNHYSSSAPAGEWFCGDAGDQSLAEWQAAVEADADGVVPTFSDPDRTLETYAAVLGLAGTVEAFVLEARQQSRHHWRPELTAPAVNDYIRAGFE